MRTWPVLCLFLVACNRDEVAPFDHELSPDLGQATDLQPKQGADLSPPEGSDLATMARDLSSANDLSSTQLPTSGWQWMTPTPHNDHAIRTLESGGALYQLTEGWAIYRSNDGGLTWQVHSRNNVALGGAKYIGRPWDMSIDPSGTTWFIVGDSGFVAKSSDGGKTFSKLTAPLYGTLFSVATPSASEVWIVTDWYLSHSVDGGVTWTSSNASYRSVWASGNDLLLGGDHSGQVTRSTDGGKTFAQKTSGLGTEVRRIVGVGQERWAVGGFGTLLHSLDAGETWAKENTPAGTKDLTDVAVNGSDVYVSGLQGTLLRKSAGQWAILPTTTKDAYTTLAVSAGYVSVGGVYGNSARVQGANVETLVERDWHVSSGVVAFASGTLLVFSSDGSVRRSSDRGKTFTKTAVTTQALWAAARGGASEAFAVSGTGDIWRTTDEGLTFNKTKHPGLNSDSLTDVWADDTGHVYVKESGGGRMYLSADSGKTWSTSSIPNSGSAGSWVGGIWSDGNGVILAGSPFTLHRSADSGLTWTQVAYLNGANIQRIAGSGKDVYVVSESGHLGVSSDGGLTFTQYDFNTGALGDWHGLWTNGNEVFVGGPWGMMFHSTDHGATWQREEIGSSAAIWGITVDANGQPLAAAGWGGLLVRR